MRWASRARLQIRSFSCTGGRFGKADRHRSCSPGRRLPNSSSSFRASCRGRLTGNLPRMIMVFGSLNIDLVARVPVIPGPGRTVLAPSYATHWGGKGANQAVAAARIAGPGKVRMAGRVGRDGFGDGALQNLAANGVDTSLIVRG